MNIKAAFPSKYLKADDLLDGDAIVTIKEIKIEDVGSTKSEEKPVLYFEETDKGVVCNKTNSTTISKLYGDETDEWIGKQIALFATEVDFQGEQVLAIRVRMKKPTQASTSRITEPPTPANGNGAMSPKSTAWANFLAKTVGKSEGDRRDLWFAALDQFFGHHDPNRLKDGDWQNFAAVVQKSWTLDKGIPMGMRTKPQANSPISDVPEFAESEIPI